MSHRLVVSILDRPSQESALTAGKHRVGSDPDCEVCIPCDEVAGTAAHVEIRGETVFLRNLNPFPIYVGEFELGANQQGEWPVGQTVLLTKSVSLLIEDVAKTAARSSADAAAKRTRSTLQIAVVIACVALGYVLLTSEDDRPDSTTSLTYSFTSLVEEVTSLPKPSSPEAIRSRRTLLNYLIDARVSDVRWGTMDPKRAIAAYELLLDLPEVRDVADSTRVEYRIRTYALARVNDLAAIFPAEN